MDEVMARIHRVEILRDILRERKAQIASKEREEALQSELAYIDSEITLSAVLELSQCEADDKAKEVGSGQSNHLYVSPHP